MVIRTASPEIVFHAEPPAAHAHRLEEQHRDQDAADDDRLIVAKVRDRVGQQHQQRGAQDQPSTEARPPTTTITSNSIDIASVKFWGLSRSNRCA